MTTLAAFALRLPKSIKAEAERQSKADGTSLNQFIAIAVAEKIAARRTAEFLDERSRRATGRALWDLLERPGSEPPRVGDELPPGYVPSSRGDHPAEALPARKSGAARKPPGPSRGRAR